jgi:hypothetical protein
MAVPDHVFEVASDMWEAPDDIEQSEIAVEYVSTTNVSLTPNKSPERTREK